MPLPREWHGGWYPPGTPGPRRTTVELRCLNPSCDAAGDYVEVDAITELGTTYLANDDESRCQECGQEMRQT